ncbi:MAG TPA: hypothetical protein VKT75_01670, partial [Acidobacteriaceae bacterium]|nr:hypothetical protein [Acidobacteriaceae bacterium]
VRLAVEALPFAFLNQTRNRNKRGAAEALPFCFAGKTRQLESAEQMRSCQTNKFARRNDFGALPEGGKVSAISRHEKIGASSIGAFNKSIVVGVRGDVETPHWADEITPVPDELQELLPETFANRELGPGQNVSVFFQDRSGYVKACRPGDRDDEGGPLKAFGLQCRRDQNVCIDDKAERKHQRFALLARAARMMRSIWREVSPLVLRRCAS